MISRIRSSKFAITKITFGLLVVAALIVAFACEQKESIETADTIEPNNIQEDVITIKSTILDDGRIKIEGSSEDVNKYKSLFSDSKDFQIESDSLGNVYLVKIKEVKPVALPDDEPVFFIVEEMPEFPGGDLALRKYIANTVEYPAIAQENGIQGKVYVTFIVAKDGSVANAKIARGVDPSLDKEALRVINNLPKWKPGKQRGKSVNVSYTVPINFVLQ